MTSATPEKPSADAPPVIEAQYEALRIAVLGEPLPPEARSGLVLFLRRGMWAWARALTVARTREQPIRPPVSTSTAPHHGRTVIWILAAMALNSNHRRAQ